MKTRKRMRHARISTDPAVMMGKPCIKGTRITVELILRKLGAGRSFEDLLEAYPKLTADDLRAALALKERFFSWFSIVGQAGNSYGRNRTEGDRDRQRADGR